MSGPKDTVKKAGSPALAAAGGGGLLIFIANSLTEYPVISKVMIYCAPAISVYGAILTKMILDHLNTKIENYKKRESLSLIRRACEQAENDPLLPSETKDKLKKKYAEMTEAAFDDHLENAFTVFPKRKQG